MIKDYILIELACKLTGMTPKRLIQPSNFTDEINARLLCYYLLAKHALMNHLFIAELFSRRRSNIMLSLDRIKSIDRRQILSCENQKLIDLIDEAEEIISERCGMTG